MTLFGGLQAPTATVALGAQYAVGDIITFTYSGSAKTNTSTTAFTFPTTLAIDNGTNTDGALALFDSGDTSVSYRVTTAPAGATFGEIDLPAPFFRTADIGAADVTVSTSSSTSQGQAFDAARLPGKLIDQTGTQFAYTVTGLSQVVDVESARRAFVAGTSTAASHAIVVTQVTDATSAGNTVAPTNVVTPGTIALTLTGDFTWLDSSTATGIQTTNITGTVLGASATQVVLQLNAGGGTVVLGNAPTTGSIPTQSLAAALSATYSGNSTFGLSSASATGAYTLNGSSVTVYAVPTSAAVSNFIWLTNSGATDGEVSIVVNDGGDEIDLGVVGTSRGGEEFDVTAAMNAALDAAGETLSGGRVHLDIITKVPAADVAVSAAYRVADDRVNLLTSLETDND